MGCWETQRTSHLDQTKLLPAPTFPGTEICSTTLWKCASPTCILLGNGELTASNLLEITVPPRSLGKTLHSASCHLQSRALRATETLSSPQLRCMNTRESALSQTQHHQIFPLLVLSHSRIQSRNTHHAYHMSGILLKSKETAGNKKCSLSLPNLLLGRSYQRKWIDCFPSVSHWLISVPHTDPQVLPPSFFLSNLCIHGSLLLRVGFPQVQRAGGYSQVTQCTGFSPQ